MTKPEVNKAELNAPVAKKEEPNKFGQNGVKRGPRKQVIGEVVAKTQVTERLLRIVLGGEGLNELNQNEHTDAYVKLLIPEPGNDLKPPFEMEELRANNPELLPKLRTYTVRSWDRQKPEITLDFVIHNEPGATGVASDWAQICQVGDQVAMHGAGGAYSPVQDPEVQHLLIGDHAALPAIFSAIEALSSGAKAEVLIHLDHEEDIPGGEFAPQAGEGVNVQFVVGDRSELLPAVAALEIPRELVQQRKLQVFCHVERGVTKELRRHLVVERGIAREDISISAYWALGRVEDQFQAEKREAIGKIDPVAET